MASRFDHDLYEQKVETVKPFKGLLPGTLIAVDSFSPVPPASIFFLTHFHSGSSTLLKHFHWT